MQSAKKPLTILTHGWDTRSEMVRWMMDLYKIPFQDVQVDMASVSDSTGKCVIPRLLCGNGESLDDLTKISVFLYAQSYPSPYRLYANVSAIDLQQVFDSQLAPLVHKVQYYILANHPNLTMKYLLNWETETWLAFLISLCWPLSKWILFYFGNLPRPQKIQSSDWKDIDALFEKAEQTAAENSYLCGSTLSAADISFASHCQGLFHWLRYSDKVPHDIFKRIQSLRERPGGILVEGILCKYPINERKIQKLAFGRSIRKTTWNDMMVLMISLFLLFLFSSLS